MTQLTSEFDEAELNALLADALPPTDDDGSVTMDGRRLDSPESVTDFFEELISSRTHSSSRD